MSAHLTVMTYNVNYALAGDAAAVRAILEGEADVVFLQESNAAWEELFRARLSAAYPVMAFQHSATRSGGGLGVLSRLPLAGSELSTSTGGRFFACRSVVQLESGDVQVLNVHLHPPIVNGSVVRGHFTTPRLRRAEMEHHVSMLDARLPALVVGDFNEDHRGDASRLLAARGMRSALREFAPRATTWRWPVGPFALRRCFDHVLYDKDAWQCVSARVIDAGSSDHLPVVAELRVTHTRRA